jgi:arylsulfatase A
MHNNILFALLLIFTGIAESAESTRPNVVIIYGDDVGFADIGANGSKLIPTPNIDRFAKESLNFTDGHCSAATCTPSRFSMLTGIYGFRHGVRILAPNAPMTIPTNVLTLPKLFKRAGYQTAVIGKWHLGLGAKGKKNDWNGEIKPGPMEIGFDSSFLLPYTNDRVPCVYLDGHKVLNLDPKDPLYVGKAPANHKSTIYPDARKDPKAMTFYKSTHGHNHTVINGIGRIGTQIGGKSALWDDTTMADVFIDRTKTWLDKRDKTKPFFLFFSSQDIHVPRAPHPRFRGKTKLGHRGDAMVAFDWATGEILKALDKHGLKENTIVIFSSDNGPVYDDGYADGTITKTSTKETDQGHDGSGLYRGGKYQIYEGGTRVPFIIRWPAKIKPGTSKALVNQIDFTASFAKFLSLDMKADEAADSRDTWKAFMGEDKQGLPFMLEEARGLAIRKGDWKYIAKAGKKKNRSKNAPARPVQGELYNLKTDVGERKNIINNHPEIAKELNALIIKIQKDSGVRNSKN